ncbi:Nn.00g113550.m01.CDS01 [Neocucurbitaria sp. VM-36]
MYETIHTEARTPRGGHAISLLDLPRELRDRIWDFGLDETKLYIEKDNHIITITYPDSFNDQQNDNQKEPLQSINTPRWLLANKQVLSEGLDQFSRRAVCTGFAQKTLLPKYPLDTSPPPPHENLLLNHIKEISLPVELSTISHKHDGTIKASLMDLSITPKPHGTRGPLYPLDARTKITSFLPNASSLHLSISLPNLERYPRPHLLRINAVKLRFLGTHFTRVHISLQRPRLAGTNDVSVPRIAPLSAYYYRLQRALVQFGGHLSRHLGTLRPASAKENWPSAEWREAQYWWVSEHMMHPCEEYEGGGTRESWYEITDWMDGEAGEWHLRITEHIGKEEEGKEEEVIHLHNTGLRYWSVAKPEREVPGYRDFKRDEVARFGERSWSCEESGEVVWVEDKEEAVTGWLLRDENGEEQKQFLPEPAQPQPQPPPTSYRQTCIMRMR